MWKLVKGSHTWGEQIAFVSGLQHLTMVTVGSESVASSR